MATPTTPGRDVSTSASGPSDDLSDLDELLRPCEEDPDLPIPLDLEASRRALGLPPTPHPPRVLAARLAMARLAVGHADALLEDLVVRGPENVQRARLLGEWLARAHEHLTAIVQSTPRDSDLEQLEDEMARAIREDAHEAGRAMDGFARSIAENPEPAMPPVVAEGRTALEQLEAVLTDAEATMAEALAIVEDRYGRGVDVAPILGALAAMAQGDPAPLQAFLRSIGQHDAAAQLEALSPDVIDAIGDAMPRSVGDA